MAGMVRGALELARDNGPAVEALRVMIREIDPQGDPVIAKHKHRSQSWRD
jgi:hypothetical protein